MHRPKRKFRRKKSERRGLIVVFTAFLIAVFLCIVALAIDTGYMAVVRAEVQRAVDAGALAGAATMKDGSSIAESTARDFVRRNIVGGDPVPDASIDVVFGNWNSATRAFEVNGDEPTAIRVSAIQRQRPMFFARVMGKHQFDSGAVAIATFQPRDIMVVLDYSASMNDDSELKRIPQLGRPAVEANLWQIYQELGAPSYGSMQFNPVYISSTTPATIRATLGLDGVPYPYPSGSWDNYFSYVQNSSAVNSAGYRRQYGYLTLINYWLDSRPMHSQTPDLWRTSEQPITAVKDALSVFLSYIQVSPTDDRVGLAIYTAADGGGLLETGLTDDLGLVESISRRRQAGHYDHYTNIGAGMQEAREEMEANGRPEAVKFIVLMTDGVANRPSSTSQARNFVIDEATLAAEAGIPIATVSLGTGADTALMQRVADMTRGIHFNVPGGRSVDEYEDDLKDAFREIADFRPSLLVQ